MQSIYRFYKMNPQSIESLEAPMIYLSNVRGWEGAGEFDFEIDIIGDESYKAFLRQYLVSGFSLKPRNDGFNEFYKLRKSILRKFNKEYLFGQIGEYIFLYDILFADAQTTKGLDERKSLIKNTFFNRIGVSCFTLDELCFEKKIFWNYFALLGNGFCIEYNFDKLNDFLRLKEIGIGQPIKYTSEKAKLKVPVPDIYKTKANYKEIIFSLRQTFSDEKEYRLAMIYEEDMAGDDNKRKLFIPKEIITSVTIGHEVSESNSGSIKKIICEKLGCENIYMMINQYDYLHRSKINI